MGAPLIQYLNLNKAGVETRRVRKTQLLRFDDTQKISIAWYRIYDRIWSKFCDRNLIWSRNETFTVYCFTFIVFICLDCTYRQLFKPMSCKTIMSNYDRGNYEAKRVGFLWGLILRFWYNVAMTVQTSFPHHNYSLVVYHTQSASASY